MDDAEDQLAAQTRAADAVATPPIPDGLLRSALEFAVDVAATGAKLRPALPFPESLKPYLRLQRLPGASLG
ncbi:MAG: hypothetical protein ABIQ39_14470, partial [Ilumatobacteraceae bacterium]